MRSGSNICSSSSSPLILVRVAVPAAQIKGHASATQHLGLSTNAHAHTEPTVCCIAKETHTHTLSPWRHLGNVRRELCWRHHSSYKYKPVSVCVCVRACVCVCAMLVRNRPPTCFSEKPFSRCLYHSVPEGVPCAILTPGVSTTK